MTLPIDRVDLESLDIADLQQQKLKELFPEVFTEGGKIDFDKLKLTLGQAIDTGKERFGMNWAGKADCYKTIQQPSVATLVPARDESIDFDTSENLFIEGDNLEVLKLLQKSYLGKVKMIYIDPPYNTGNDFIYPDNYSENLDTYLEYTGQIDGEGRKFSTNPDTDGRFHSKWMNMMYPRLFLAKNLLNEDGVIFVQIDDKEFSNLKQVMDDIFGEENFVNSICVKMSHLSGVKMSHKDKKLPKLKEFILLYSKDKEKMSINPIYVEGSWEDVLDRYNWYLNKNDSLDCEKWVVKSLNETIREMGLVNLKDIEKFKIQYADNIFRTATNDSLNISKNTTFQRIITARGLEKLVYKGEEVLFASSKIQTIDGKRVPADVLGDIWTDIGINNLHKEGEVKFENGKKPIRLIKRLITLVTKSSNDIILDFFAGSATTAHAVMDLNKEDGGNRKFICVQLPEPTDEKSEAYKVGYKTIADISKERIRRASAKIQAEQTEAKGKADLFDEGKANNLLDLGFRVFKLQKSNFKVWDANTAKDAEGIQQALELHIDHIDPQAEQEAILFELLLKSGFELTTPIENLTLAGKTVFSIAEGALLICLDKTLTSEVIKAMAELNPSRVICLDEGFQDNDQLKTNAVLIMKSKGVNDFRTV